MQKTTTAANASGTDVLSIFIAPKDVAALIGLSLTTIWRLQRRGKFPEPHRLSPGRVGFLRAEVELWAADRVSQ